MRISFLTLLFAGVFAQNQTTTSVTPVLSSSKLIQSTLIASTAAVTSIPQVSATVAVTVSATSTPISVPAATNGTFNVRVAVLILGSASSYGIPSMVQSLDSYGIPADIVSEVNAVFPTLNLEDASGILPLKQFLIRLQGGRYSLIVFADGYSFALTPALDAILNTYQIKYGARRVGFNMWPGSVTGITIANAAATGCCAVNQEQFLRWDAVTLNTTNSGINPAGVLSSQGLYHYPALISDPTTLSPLLYADAIPGTYATQSVVGVIQKTADGRKNMFFFMSVGSWSVTSILINHVWIGWGMRSLYPGYRRVIFSTQIDDVLLNTGQWNPALQVADDTNTFRLVQQDLINHATWMKSLNSRLPAGSSYVIELAFNGNGALDFTDDARTVQYDQPDVNGIYLFKKPNNTGNTYWPATYDSNWVLTNMAKDGLFAYLAGTTVNQYYILSHTFTHLDLNNVTRSDVVNEILYNQKFASAQYANLVSRSVFSPHALITPAITGLLNGDALSAFAQQGLTSIVGDNSRLLYDPNHRHWPLITTLAGNGYDGFTIIPRAATEVYYNVNTQALNLNEYNYLYTAKIGVTNDYATLLTREASRVISALLLLQHDANMFHQANLDTTLQPITTLSGISGQHSLLMTWVEYITTAYMQLVTWPIISVKQDQLFQMFTDRKARDGCGYVMYANVVGGNVGSVTVSSGSACKVPVTVPVRADTGSEVGKVREQLATGDVITYWTNVTSAGTVFKWATPFGWN